MAGLTSKLVANARAEGRLPPPKAKSKAKAAAKPSGKKKRKGLANLILQLTHDAHKGPVPPSPLPAATARSQSMVSTRISSARSSARNSLTGKDKTLKGDEVAHAAFDAERAKRLVAQKLTITKQREDELREKLMEQRSRQGVGGMRSPTNMLGMSVMWSPGGQRGKAAGEGDAELLQDMLTMYIEEKCVELQQSGTHSVREHELKSACMIRATHTLVNVEAHVHMLSMRCILRGSSRVKSF
jgi:hypothetical protein